MRPAIYLRFTIKPYLEDGDIVALYSGSLHLENSWLGGLTARVVLTKTPIQGLKYQSGKE